MTKTELDNFTRSYIESALWSSTDDDGNPLDGVEYADTELADETIARFVADCTKFQADYARVLIEQGYEDDSQVQSLPAESHFAHDFWLTRNRHGAGFWDGDYPKALGKALTDLAHSYGECDLYIGDDGKIYAA